MRRVVQDDEGLALEFDDRLFQVSWGSSPQPQSPARRGGGAFDDQPELLSPEPPDAGPARSLVDSLVKRGEVERASATLVLGPGPAASSDTQRAFAPTAPTRLTVGLAAGEQAVVLIEGDGVLAWRFGRPADPLSPAAGPLSKRSGTGVDHALVFDIDVPPIGAPAPASARRGWLRDRLVEGAKAIVLYFAAELAADGVVRLLERKRRNGPVVVTSATDPGLWLQPDDFRAVKLPADRPPRILLLVHGTFSSTVGGFGGLSATPWGQRLLTAALGRYDAVLGFDHRTLSMSPLENAQNLLDSLRTLSARQPIEVDAICHSRGGLVLRTLVERLLPPARLKLQFKRAVFVAATNNGTELARPANWETLVDLVTNLAAVTGKVLSLFPAAAPTAVVTEEVISCIGDFVKYLVEVAVEKRKVPGIAAMEPDGAFVSELNRTQPGQPTAQELECFAIVSDFHARLLDGNGEHEPKEFPRRLAFVLADGVVDRLMRGEGAEAVANDLVVDVGSMTDIDASVGGFVKDVLDFGRNALVYHTNYFLRPETAGRLAQWLHLPSPLEGIDTLRLAGAQRTLAPIRADATVQEARVLIEREAPDFMVIARQDPRTRERKLLHYAVKPNEFIARARGVSEEATLIETFDLHEPDSSPRYEPQKIPFDGADLASDSQRPHARRGVVLSAGAPAAVLDRDFHAADTAELVALANELSGSAPAAPAPAGAETPSDGYEAITHKRGGGDLPPVSRVKPPRGGKAPKPAAESVDLYATAEMPGEARLNRDVALSVTLSAEQIEATAGQASSQGRTKVQAGEKLAVQVVPRRGFDYSPRDRSEGYAEVDPPQPGQPVTLDFALLANEAGEGEVTVAVRQGAVRKLMLTLRSSVVDRAQTARTSVTSSAPMVNGSECGSCATLEILDRRNAGQLQYQFALRAGDVYNRFRSDPIEVDPQAYVDARYDEIQKAWLGSQRARDRFATRLETIGGNIFKQLFPIELKRALWRLAEAGALDGIQVQSDEPFLPWELVFLDDPDAPAATGRGRFFGELGLCRWLYGSSPVCSISVRPGAARYVIPHYPKADKRLANAEEVEEPMLKKMGATAVVPSHAEVVKLLKKPGSFDLLHFACHGAADSQQIDSAALLLEGEVFQSAGGPAWGKESLLASTVDHYADLRGPDGRRPLVVVNACQTGQIGYSLTGLGGFATAFLGAREGTGDTRGKAGAFVGALWSVGDQPASTFVAALYEELKKGRTIAQASGAARAAAKDAGEGSWLAYTVYAHPNLKVQFQ